MKVRNAAFCAVLMLYSMGAAAGDVTVKITSGPTNMRYEDHQSAGFSIVISRVARFRVEGGSLPPYETFDEGSQLRLRFAPTNPSIRSSSGGLGEMAVAWDTQAIPAQAAPAIAAAKIKQDENDSPKHSVEKMVDGKTISIARTGLAEALNVSTPEEVKKNIKNFLLDFSIPDSPGFVVIGANPQKIVHPKSMRELSAAIINGVDESGKAKSGLALDFQPMALLNSDISLADFREIYDPKKNRLGYAAFNTSVSIATLQGTTEGDKSMKLGIGVHIPLINKNDTRFDTKLSDCYDKIFAEIDSNTPAKRNMNEPGSVGKPSNAKGFKSCYDKSKRDVQWNSDSWIVGLGQAWTSDTGDFKDRKATTRGLWTSYAHKLQESSQLVLHVRAMDNERVVDPKNAGQFLNQDSSILGASFRTGSETFTASLQASYQRIKPDGRDQDKLKRVALGFDIRVAKDVWLTASVGGEGGRKDGESKSFVLGGLKFGSATSPIFGPDK